MTNAPDFPWKIGRVFFCLCVDLRQFCEGKIFAIFLFGTTYGVGADVHIGPMPCGQRSTFISKHELFIAGFFASFTVLGPMEGIGPYNGVSLENPRNNRIVITRPPLLSP